MTSRRGAGCSSRQVGPGGGRVDTALAIFGIVNDNVTAPVTPDFSEQVGEERAKRRST